MNTVEQLENQLLLANAQIVVKDEALRMHGNVCLDRCPGDCGKCRACKTKQALINSPAAAKELIARMERMRLFGNNLVMCIENHKQSGIAWQFVKDAINQWKEALSTTQNPTKE